MKFTLISAAIAALGFCELVKAAPAPQWPWGGNNWGQQQQNNNPWGGNNNNNWGQQQQNNNPWGGNNNNNWGQPQQNNNQWNNQQQNNAPAAQDQAQSPAASNFPKGSGLQFYTQCKNPMNWAMTFDDGPTEFADDILDLLKQNNIKATFFIVGHMYMDNNDPNWSRIIKRMYNEGHTVGNHTYDHEDLTKLSPDQIKAQMKGVEDKIFAAIGKKPAFMRPPYGSGNGNQNVMNALSQAGYTAAINWNVDPMDYSNGGDINYAKQVINQAKGKPIITLNHLKYGGATKDGILALAKAEIDTMKANGYTSVNMEECLGMSAYQ